MKTTQRFVVSAMAAAVLLALGACGQMSTRDQDSAMSPAPVVAQGPLPQCENSNYDQARGIFTIINPAKDAVNQQCLITVHPAQAAGSQGPAPFLVEGRYDILMSGGGGGGAGGEYWNQGGGGGGGGAPPMRDSRYLSPGVYKMTIGTGGAGGMPGKRTDDGNLTNMTNVATGELIAGYANADIAKQTSQPAGNAHGGAATPGGSSGGDGGDAGPKNSESAAQAGGSSQTAGYAGVAGDAGTERSVARRDDGKGPQANAGGGGGAGVGSGGTGESRDGARAGGFGDLGGGGAGGRGGFFTADPGGQGGHGFIQLARSGPSRQAIAPAPEVVAVAPAVVAAAPERAPVAEARTVEAPAPLASRPAKKDRN